MNNSARNVYGVPRLDDPLFLFDPLFHLAFEDVDDFVHFRVAVKRMAGAGRDLGSHEGEVVSISQALLEVPEVGSSFEGFDFAIVRRDETCLLYTSPSPRDGLLSRMPSSA